MTDPLDGEKDGRAEAAAGDEKDERAGAAADERAEAVGGRKPVPPTSARRPVPPTRSPTASTPPWTTS